VGIPHGDFDGNREEITKIQSHRAGLIIQCRLLGKKKSLEQKKKRERKGQTIEREKKPSSYQKRGTEGEWVSAHGNERANLD